MSAGSGAGSGSGTGSGVGSGAGSGVGGTAVAVLGAGSIGVAFAVLFAGAGWTVRVWDAYPEAFGRARHDLDSRLDLLAEHDLLHGSAADAASRVSFVRDLEEAVSGARLVQECAPERVELKRELFEAVDRLARADAVLASSSSAITPSSIAETAGDLLAARLIVAHPGNPPYLLSVIELVPSPRTDPEVLERATAIYRAVGMKPVVVRKEVEGFLFNRLQGAVLREAYALVRDGVASVDDIDEVMRSGLGRRWSFIGPFETVDLNTRGGLLSHAEKMGPAYERMGAERGQHDPWTPDLVAEAVSQRRAILPLDEWERRVAWRDEQLMKLKPLWDGMTP